MPSSRAERLLVRPPLGVAHQESGDLVRALLIEQRADRVDQTAAVIAKGPPPAVVTAQVSPTVPPKGEEAVTTKP
jgi:hypothetical protein